MKRTLTSAILILACLVCRAQQFVYFTDAHVEKDEPSKTSEELDKILTENPVKTVIFGGDGTMTCEGCRTKEDIDESWRKFDMITDVVKEHKCGFYLVRGNHEVTTGTIDPSVAGFTYSQQYVYQLLRNKMVNTKVTELGNNTLNYYFDEKPTRVRYIFLDPYSSAEIDLEKRYGVGIENNSASSAFLESSIKSLPKGYKCLIFLHQGMNKCTGIGDYGNVAKMLEIVNANAEKVIMVLHGHVHKDVETFENGVLHVSTTSSNPHQAKASLFGEDDRTYNSKLETAIDVVKVDNENGRIIMNRVGGGYSRIIHINPYVVKQGGKIRLKSSLKYITDWKIYDVDGISAPSWVNWETQAKITHTHAEFGLSLRPNIHTVAGIDQGEVVVVAFSKKRREREIFYVRCE